MLSSWVLIKSLQCCDFGSSLIGGSLGSLWRCGLHQVFETWLSWELILTKTQILTYIHIYLCRWQFHIFLDKDNNISMQVATSYFHRQIQCVSQHMWHFHISFDKAMLIHPPSHNLTIVLLTHINWSLQGVHNCCHFWGWFNTSSIQLRRWLNLIISPVMPDEEW
jgi:hypothetical protein